MNDVLVSLNPDEGYRTRITAGNNSLIADEPVDAGGNDEGMSPYELLLSALGACTAMTLRMYIDRKKLPVTGIDVRLSFHKVKPEEPGGTEIHQITREIIISGEVTEEMRERLQYIATRCPVHLTLHSDPQVVDRLVVVPPGARSGQTTGSSTNALI